MAENETDTGRWCTDDECEWQTTIRRWDTCKGKGELAGRNAHLWIEPRYVMPLLGQVEELVGGRGNSKKITVSLDSSDDQGNKDIPSSQLLDPDSS